MKIRNMVLSALFAALLAVCAWISLPLGAIHFTLQTFGIFLALLILGGKWGCVSILVYIALGAMGLPVFSGFQGGIGVLLGPTGGCIFGFMLIALLYWLATVLLGQKPLIQLYSDPWLAQLLFGGLAVVLPLCAHEFLPLVLTLPAAGRRKADFGLVYLPAFKPHPAKVNISPSKWA